MTFNDVILKNFKGSFQKYFSYFLCCSFTIMMFFMYASIMFNSEFANREDTDVLQYVMPITMVAIAVFSVFFILYAHSSFLKGRNKEFGVYMTLGITQKELNKIVIIENILIDLIAMVAGIAVGTLFSRFFQMIVLRLLQIDNIHFELNYRAFALSIVVFIAIYLIIIMMTAVKMHHMDISSLLTEARKSEGEKYTVRNTIFGVIGLIGMGLSVVYVIIIAQNDKLNSNPLILCSYMLLAFLGVYLAISNGGNFIIHVLKISRFYHKNMLAITQIHYKFNQNKKIIFVLSVLSTVTIVFAASPFSLFNLSESIAQMNKNHIEYAELAGNNTADAATLNRILSEQAVKSNQVIPFLYGSTVNDNSNLATGKTVLSASMYNQYMNCKIAIPKGTCLNLNLDWRPGNQGVIPGENYKIYVGETEYDFQVLDSVRGAFVVSGTVTPTLSILLVSDEDYAEMQETATQQNTGYFHLVNYDNWKTTKPIVDQLNSLFSGSQLPVTSTITTYQDLRKGYSVFLFISFAVSILFFIAGGSVLYFKQYTELPETKTVFYKLFKIGITKKEVNQTIGIQLGVVFFVPLLFGSFLGLSLIYLMTHIVGGQQVMSEFFKNSIYVIILYFVFQGVFFIFTKRKYTVEIEHSLKG